MTRRFMVLVSASAVMACVLWADGAPSTHAASPQQKKSPPKKKDRGVVDGTLWSFVATNPKGKQIRFRYRNRELVHHDPESNAVIGQSEGIAPGRTRVTFNEQSQFPATFEIRKQQGQHWTGQAEYQGDTWAIELRAAAR